MGFIYSPNDSSSRKTRVRIYFYEIPRQRIFFHFSTENFSLKQNGVSYIKFTETCRAGGKSAEEDSKNIYQ